MIGSLMEVLLALAHDYEFDENELINYAKEDELGGYNPAPNHTHYPGNGNKGVWEVEGKILYALIRATKPLTVLEIGNEWCNSTSHIIAALRANGQGHLYTVDIKDAIVLTDDELQWATPIVADLFWFNYKQLAPIDFVFEDSFHTADMVGHVWGKFLKYALHGAFIVSHDAEHPKMKAGVTEGMLRVTDQYNTYLATPSDCGLAVWRK